MKTKWIFPLLAALLSLCGLTACVTDGVPYYGGGNLGGGAWSGGGWNGGGWGSGWNNGWNGGGWNNGWGGGGRVCCPRCGFNPCRCGAARWDHDHDHDRDRRSSGSGTLYRIKDPEKGEPRGYYSKDWFEERGYKFSRNTWETKSGNTVRGNEVPKIVRDERKESSSRSRGSSQKSSSSSRSSSRGSKKD